MEAEKTDVLLTAADVARWLKIRTSTVYEATAAGRIPCVRLWVGHRRALIRFRPCDIARLIDERSSASPTNPATPQV